MNLPKYFQDHTVLPKQANSLRAEIRAKVIAHRLPRVNDPEFVKEHKAQFAVALNVSAATKVSEVPDHDLPWLLEATKVICNS